MERRLGALPHEIVQLSIALNVCARADLAAPIGIQRLDIGLGFKSGLSVGLLAIILDRITQSFGLRDVAPSKRRFAPFLHRFFPVFAH